MSNPIVLYDGVCGLCNSFVQFILERDRKALFRFASLQSNLAASILARHQRSPNNLDTVYVVLDFESKSELLLSRSEAVSFVLKQLSFPWRAAGGLLQFVPKFLRDAGYNAIAARRYRIFGRSEACTLSCDQDRSRFLDL